MIYGEPHRRMLERDGKPLSAEDQRKEQEKLDKAVAKLERETPEQRARREAEYEKEREKDREFLREVPDLYDFQLLGDDKIDGHDVWVISATPKPGYEPKRRDAKPLLKIKGASSGSTKPSINGCAWKPRPPATISFGLFMARLESGREAGVRADARERRSLAAQARGGAAAPARLGLVKKLAGEQEVTWNNYRKFQVDSKIVATQ